MSKKKIKKTFLLLLVGLLLFNNNIIAQVTTAQVSGKITDSQGIPLQGVSILVTNMSTSTKYGAQTNEDGRYVITNLNPGGPYSLSVTYVGFKKDDREGVSLNLGNSTQPFIKSGFETSIY